MQGMGVSVVERLYERIGQLRKEQGLSLREAAARSDGRISHAHLRALEVGHDTRSKNPLRPAPETLKVIAEIYNASYEELMQLAGYLEPKADGSSEDKHLEDMWPNLSPDRRRRAARMERDAWEAGIEDMHLSRGLTNQEFDDLLHAISTFAAFVAKQKATE